MGKYWLHRISCEEKIADLLFKAGYLSIGWSLISGQQILDSASDRGLFDQFWKKTGMFCYRSRWCVFRFANFSPGDIVVVPRSNGVFSVVKVLEKAMPIAELDLSDVTTLPDSQFSIKDKLLHIGDRTVDLGFVCKVSTIVKDVSRVKYAKPALVSRMKIRLTNAAINDISEYVKDAIDAAGKNTPINFYEDVKSDLAKVFLDKIRNTLNPDAVERLVKLYFEACGATRVSIPAKNDPAKSENADADVIAEFEPLKTIYYVQVKKHNGDTGEWGVEQIEEYTDMFNCGDEGYTYIPWVISTSDGFTEEAKKKAKEAASDHNILIRLINGIEFSKMMLDCGLGILDEFSL